MVFSQLRGFARAIADRGFWSAGGRGAARWLPGGVFRHPAFPGAGRRPLSILFARAEAEENFATAVRLARADPRRGPVSLPQLPGDVLQENT